MRLSVSNENEPKDQLLYNGMDISFVAYKRRSYI